MTELSGVWRHYKGAHYLVLGVASDSNNVRPRSEPQVVYVSLEGFHRGGNSMHTRSRTEFLERFVPAEEADRFIAGEHERKIYVTKIDVQAAQTIVNFERSMGREASEAIQKIANARPEDE